METEQLKRGVHVYDRLMAEMESEGEEGEDEDTLCGVVCFVVGVVLVMVLVGVIATLIVLGVDERRTIDSLTSTHPSKPLSPGVMESLDPANINARVLDHTWGSPNELDLLILVRSLPEASSARTAIRKTWMKAVPQSVEVLFVVPAGMVPTSELDPLELESTTHRDMVVFLDGPVQPESEALLLELVWSSKNRRFAYLMKTRDCMYVRVQALLRQLVWTLKDAKSNAYLGYFQAHENPWNEKSTKLAEPEWYLCDSFIRFAHSGGYILSGELVRRLSSLASLLYPYNNEDVALGTWLSPYSDVNLTHSVHFDTEIGRSRGCSNHFLVFPSTDMPSQHSRLEGDGPVCLDENEVIKPYWYDFSAPPSKCCTAFSEEGPLQHQS